MMPLLLTAVAAIGGKPSTLGGVTLGSNVAQVLAQHPGAQGSDHAAGHWWRWIIGGGGTVTVTSDSNGAITRVDFQADKGQGGSIDLPCVGAFPIQDSDADLDRALTKTPCSAFNGEAYGLPDRSVVQVRFGGLGDGQLAEAIWYRPTTANPSPVGHMSSVIDYIRPELGYIGGAARIYYAGECPMKVPSSLVQPLVFPNVWFQRPLPETTGLDAVRQIFRDDPNVTVMRDRSGMLRITIGRVSSTLLQTRLSILKLDPSMQYNALSAIDAITVAASSYAKERGLPFAETSDLIDHLASGPGEGRPHLPATTSNITIDDALDAVAQTFKGIVTYGQCRGPNGKTLFRFGFIWSS